MDILQIFRVINGVIYFATFLLALNNYYKNKEKIWLYLSIIFLITSFIMNLLFLSDSILKINNAIEIRDNLNLVTAVIWFVIIFEIYSENGKK